MRPTANPATMMMTAVTSMASTAIWTHSFTVSDISAVNQLKSQSVAQASLNIVDDQLPEGLYDALHTFELEERLRLSIYKAEHDGIHKADRPEILSRHVGSVVRRILANTRVEDQLGLVNEIIAELGSENDRVIDLTRLVRLVEPTKLGQNSAYRTHPSTPLSEAALLTNSAGEPSLGTEIRAELESADQVDLLCAFIKWQGIRTLEAELRQVAERGVPLRVITTTYMGATDRHALDRLVRDFGADVKVSYELERTRLHAKAWLFRRASRFDTAYVGSSNLSRAALLDGVEWNVRLSSVATPTLLRKFRATFDSYWADPAYESYDPERDGERLKIALAEAGGSRQRDRQTLTLSGLEVRPYPHQQEALEAIEAERAKGRHRNLVIAATGTGKTVIAALDYRRLSDDRGRRPSLLFVAHRREILEQALRTYREVLNDPNFGDLYVAGAQPSQTRHLFASVQTLNARNILTIEPAAFEIVVIDEFHHAAANSYRLLLDHLEPAELLGLTATPERADGINIRRYFDDRAAVELRIWDALSAELLSPFHYFGVGDGTDLRALSWTRGAYDFSQLSQLYTGNDARARIILSELEDKVVNTREMRALGFCVTVDHAHYMAQVFNKAGIPALAVSGTTPSVERAQALTQLARKDVNIIFTVDLYNEGIDLPDIDTVLFLRPTESATVFLQQLGRGLRRTRDKAVLTVLDFVGHQRKEFRFDRRFTALTGIARSRLKDAVEYGFPYLPSGCQIVLDKTSQEAVLANLRNQLGSRWKSIVDELRSSRAGSLDEFLDQADIDVADVVNKKGSDKRTWTRARREAGLPTRSGGPQDAYLLGRVPNLAHVDDALRAQVYLDLLSDDAPNYEDLDSLQKGAARMLFFSLWPNLGGHASYAVGLASLGIEQAFRDEASQVITYALARANHVPRPLRSMLANPLRTHAHYSREEILSALDWASMNKPINMREGVFSSETWDAECLLVTLTKNEKDFSPTTMYRDFAISPDLFHWESQSGTSQTTPVGRRYLTHREMGSHIVLFSRNVDKGPLGNAMPYLCLGTCDFVQAEGDRPIAITWRLHRPMPQDHFQLASVHAR